MKLYGYEVNTGSRLFWKLIKGGQLSYREKKQLSRAVNDTSRLIPFTIFAIIPFSELTLPFVLKVGFHCDSNTEIPQFPPLDLHLRGQKGRYSSEHSRSASRPRARILRSNEGHGEEASPRRPRQRRLRERPASPHPRSRVRANRRRGRRDLGLQALPRRHRAGQSRQGAAGVGGEVSERVYAGRRRNGARGAADATAVDSAGRQAALLRGSVEEGLERRDCKD